jgi:hypothetical protein
MLSAGQAGSLATGLFLFPAYLPGIELSRDADRALRSGISRPADFRTIQQFEL